jgi:hypothetical protein
MTHSFPRHVAFGLTITLLLAAATPTHARTSRWKLKKGQKLGYTITQTSNVSVNMMGTPVKAKVTYIVNDAWTVKSVDKNGNAMVAHRLTRIRMQWQGLPFGKIEYDSDKKKPKGDLAKKVKETFGPLANAEFTTTLTPRGELKDAKISDKLKAALQETRDADPGIGGLAVETFTQMTAGAQFPEGNLTKGKTWTQTSKVKSPQGTMVTKTTMEYLGTTVIDGRTLAKIELKPRFAFDPVPAGATIKDKGSTGLSHFDVKRGVMTASDRTTKLEITMTVAGKLQTTVIRNETHVRLDAQK